MKYNPKVVSFNRSAAYVHHRALKNKRNNNSVEALELMRQAVEHSPENREYRLDLAEMYCEMGCHEQSNRILLDIIARMEASEECYYALALNQFARNENESARQALSLYRRYARDGEYSEDAGWLCEEMDACEAMRRPPNRKQGRAFQMGRRAGNALRANDLKKACRLFEKSLELDPNQAAARALYALALCIKGDPDAALTHARSSIAAPDVGANTLCIASQVFLRCGKMNECVSVLRCAQRCEPTGDELRLLVYTLSEMNMHTEAAEVLKRALWLEPHDKNLLHMRAVALHYLGHPDARLRGFWLRILRIDPDDDIARYYLDCADHGKLGDIQPGYVYEVPEQEYARRFNAFAEFLNEGLERCIERWKSDVAFRRLLLWMVNTGDESAGRAAVMVIASADDAESESVLRELFYRGDVLASVKIHALTFMRLRNGDVDHLMPGDLSLQDALLPEPEEILKKMPACERQLVRFAAEVLEYEFGIRAKAVLAAMWQNYRSVSMRDNDPLVCTQEAAAALVWNYLLDQGEKLSVERLARAFGCRQRRMVFYARHMAAVLEKQEEGLKNDEGH